MSPGIVLLILAIGEMMTANVFSILSRIVGKRHQE
jgi:hypothetical protein